MIWLALLASTAATASEAPIAAPQVASKAEPTQDFAAVEAAVRLLRSQDYEKQMEEAALRSANASFDTMFEHYAQEGSALPADLVDEIRLVILNNTRDLVEEMKKTALNDAAAIYARYFTAAEINELMALQSHPVMKKVQQVTRRMMPELMQIGLKTAAARQVELKAKIAETIESWQARQPNESDKS
ncbi:DUF2059 domain-containing protein [Sphingomonas cavernae]|nr:DUF2059 domain-containing protein [Sphingomonas cavernae]